jgi:metacaspase-1
MRRALCVGINDYPVRGSDLKGCVNDARAWATVLSERYGFPSGEIELLLDKAATKKAMLDRIDGLLAGAKANDVLVVTISSHGTYVADTSGDEERYDEAICPWDMKTDLIVDDELRERFLNLPSRCRLTVISDSCFSGSVTRAPGLLPTPDDRRPRFVRPRELGLPELEDVRRATPVRTGIPESAMKEVLISGCNDHQTSFDARFGNVYHGAMTFCALEILKAAGYRLTYQELWDQLVVRLDREGFDQEPQVEGKDTAKRRQVFS